MGLFQRRGKPTPPVRESASEDTAALVHLVAILGALDEVRPPGAVPRGDGQASQIRRIELAGISAAHLLLKVLEVERFEQIASDPPLRMAAESALVCIADAIDQRYDAPTAIAAALAAVRLGLSPDYGTSLFNRLQQNPRVLNLFFALGSIVTKFCDTHDARLLPAMRAALGDVAETLAELHRSAKQRLGE